MESMDDMVYISFELAGTLIALRDNGLIPAHQLRNVNSVLEKYEKAKKAFLKPKKEDNDEVKS